MATIKDVAKRAGVSTTTVSHVINKTRFVAEETRNAVWQAIQELHYSPSAVARKVGSLNKLLEARSQLSNLMTYMDGKTGAEDLLAKVLEDPALLQTLATSKKPEDGAAEPAAPAA